MATNQQQVALIPKLCATGLVLDVEMFPWDEHSIARMKESPIHRGTTQGEVDGNAFEHEPPRVGTTVSRV